MLLPAGETEAERGRLHSEWQSQSWDSDPCAPGTHPSSSTPALPGSITRGSHQAPLRGTVRENEDWERKGAKPKVTGASDK